MHNVYQTTTHAQTKLQPHLSICDISKDDDDNDDDNELFLWYGWPTKGV